MIVFTNVCYGSISFSVESVFFGDIDNWSDKKTQDFTVEKYMNVCCVYIAVISLSCGILKLLIEFLKKILPSEITILWFFNSGYATICIVWYYGIAIAFPLAILYLLYITCR